MKPSIFQHPLYGELPVVVVDGMEWFGATEAARSLSFANPYTAIQNHIDEDDLSDQEVTDSLGRRQYKKFTNESGLYSLIIGAAKQGNNPEIKEKAKTFKRWVTSEVLPAIRKTGSYSIKKQLPQTFGEALRMLADQVDENERLQTQNLMLEQQVKEYEPKISYIDTILQSKDTVTITQIAKDYGLSGKALNDILHEEKVQYKINGQWLLYAKHQDKGYTKSRTIDIFRTGGERDVKMNTQWTQKGRLFIHEILTNRGILPYMDRQPA